MKKNEKCVYVENENDAYKERWEGSRLGFLGNKKNLKFERTRKHVTFHWLVGCHDPGYDCDQGS